jgi:hypothetical protein
MVKFISSGLLKIVIPLILLFALPSLALSQTSCNGCLNSGKCYNYGSSHTVYGSLSYCSISGIFEEKKQDDSSCDNSFECINGFCLNSKCTDLNEKLTEIKGGANDVFKAAGDIDIVLVGKNEKDPAKYKSKEVFLISEDRWQDIFSLVPVTTWEDSEKKIHKYPTLIYYKESNTRFDIDSIIDFLNMYKPTKVTVVGYLPNNVKKVLVAQPPFGSGISGNQIKTITSQDYFSYWKSYRKVVYSEKDYAHAMLASNFASLINAPLVIEENNQKNALIGRYVICVGNPKGECDEKYDLNGLRERYMAKTKTNKLLLVNSNDLNIAVRKKGNYIFKPEKSPKKIASITGKFSLAAPFLASAKEELIISTTSKNHDTIDNFIESQINNLNKNSKYLTIVASPKAIPHRLQMGKVKGYNNFLALDPGMYGDLDSDGLPDVAVGRIQGITVSDVSSYIARSIFYKKLPKNNNMIFMATGDEENDHAVYKRCVLNADLYDEEFRKAGFNSNKDVHYVKRHDFNTNLWKNQQLIYYCDHGSSDWAGISFNQIPVLSNSIVIPFACSTCAKNNAYSFCSHAIRKGAIAYVGFVGTSFTNNNILKRFISNMTTLLGDPTLDINPDYYLENPIPL